MTWAPPVLLARLCQCRWDTSPYRGAHKLTWTRLNRPRWPVSGSMVWHATWGFQKPLPPAGLRDVAASRIPFTPVIRPKLAEGPQRLQQRLMMEIGLAPQDALAYIQRSRVMVDGKIQKTNRWVEDSQQITLNGHSLTELSTIAFLAHKPAGYALTEGDPLKRPTYQELLPDPSLVARPLSPIDLPSSGLLLLTNIPQLRRLAGPRPSALLPTTFMVRLRERPNSFQLALLESNAPYQDGMEPLLIQDITEDDEEEVEVPELAPLPDDLGALDGSSIAKWPTKPQRKQAVQPKELLPMLLVVVRGGTAQSIRKALTFAELQPREVCCIRWGPLTLEEMNEPGSLRPLSKEEVDLMIDATSGE